MVGGIRAANTLQDLPELLASFGEAPALISFKDGVSKTLTFRDLVERAGNIAKALQDRGVGTGEPIGILAPNGPLWVTACLAILATGAAVAPIDAQQTKAEQVRLLKMIGCRFFLGDLEGSGVGLQDCPFTSPLITEFPILYALPLPSGFEHTGKAAASHVATPGDLALILHTLGTAGIPKAVPLSHENILSNLTALAAAGVAGPSERALIPLPLHHIYPLVVGLLLPLSTGGSVVLLGGFSGPELARALRSGGATVLIGVPRLYESFLAMIMGRIDARGGVSAWAFHRLLSLSVALARRRQRSFGQLAFKAIRHSAGPVGITEAAVRREGRDISLITYGGSLWKTLEAAALLANEAIDAEVIDLRTLRPLDDATIMTSVQKTRRAVIVDEGWRSGSVAAEIGIRIVEQAFWELDAPIGRVCSEEVPIPYPRHLEIAAIPQVPKIIAAAKAALGRT